MVRPTERGQEGLLVVRARVRDDLDRFRDTYAEGLGPVIEGAGTDYPYRAYISREGFAEAMYEASLDVDYGNFKDTVESEHGRSRHDLYARVWNAMDGAEEKLAAMDQRDLALRR